MTLLDAFRSVAATLPELRADLTAAIGRIEGGSSISDSLRGRLPAAALERVEVGEPSGTLDAEFDRGALLLDSNPLVASLARIAISIASDRTVSQALLDEDSREPGLAWTEIRREVDAGGMIGESMLSRPGLFPTAVGTLVRQAEVNGDIVRTLFLVADATSRISPAATRGPSAP